VLSVPIRVHGRVAGACAVLETAARQWGPADVEAVSALAGMVGGLLRAGAGGRAQREVIGRLEHALDSRVVVEQAKGALMATHRIGAEEAFERMRTVARGANRKVADVAAEVLLALTG
jgi:hypothetical protein